MPAVPVRCLRVWLRLLFCGRARQCGLYDGLFVERSLAAAGSVFAASASLAAVAFKLNRFEAAARGALLLFPLQPQQTEFVTITCVVRLLLQQRCGRCFDLRGRRINHADAVNRAGGNTQLATLCILPSITVCICLLRRQCIYRTRLNTQGAADTDLLINYR